MRKKRFFWIGISMVAVMMVSTQCSWAVSTKRSCATHHVNRTFMQLWRSDALRTDQQWNTRLQALQELGFKEIILQWSTYGKVSFFDDPRKRFETVASLPPLIRSAARYGIKIKIGLQYDPEFWNRIGPAQDVMPYLKNHLSEIIDSLDPLLAVVAQADPNGSVVNGWYISDEIDDVHWQGDKHRDALTAYLSALRKHLARKKQNWPVAISGFATGELSPKQWARFWKTLLHKTGIDTFLFQDGIGTGKMAMSDLAGYLSALITTLNDPTRFGVIVEIFNIDPTSPAFKTQSADFERIARQLEIAGKYTHQEITVFSAPDHLIGPKSAGKTELHRLWREDRMKCRR